jgi:hypothetical protein
MYNMYYTHEQGKIQRIQLHFNIQKQNHQFSKTKQNIFTKIISKIFVKLTPEKYHKVRRFLLMLNYFTLVLLLLLSIYYTFREIFNKMNSSPRPCL